MPNSLVEELRTLRAAYNDWQDAEASLRAFQRAKPWILAGTSSTSSSIKSQPLDELLLKSNEQVSMAMLETFYNHGLASRSLEQDEAWADAQRRLALTQEKIDSGRVILAELEEKNRSISSKISQLNRLDTSYRLKAERDKYAEFLREAQEQTNDEVSKFDAELGALSPDISASSVIGRLVIGALIGAVIYAPAILVAFVDKSILDNPVLNLVLAVVFFFPLAKFLISKRRSYRLKKDAIQIQRDEARNKGTEKCAQIEEKLKKAQKELDTAELQAKDRDNQIAKLQEQLNENTIAADKQRAQIVALETERDDEQGLANHARQAFLRTLQDEFNAAKETAQREYEAKEMPLKKAVDNATRRYNNARNLKSADAAYEPITSPKDLTVLNRVITKLETNRAKTLSEALNAVDAELRAEEMHAEQMAQDKEHKRQLESIERARVEEAARANQALERQAREKAEAELKLQRDMVQAAQERSAAEQERLRLQQEDMERQQEALIQAAEMQEAQERAFIKANVEHCRYCRNRPSYISTFDPEDTFCEAGGWTLGQSDLCQCFESEY